MRITRTLTAVAVTALALTGVAGTQSAEAASPYCKVSTCTLWAGPSASTARIDELPFKTSITMRCWVDGTSWNGTKRWFKVSTNYGDGFVNAGQVGDQARVNRC